MMGNVYHTPERASAGHSTILVRPWYAKLRDSVDEGKALTALGDILLPELISGELRIKDAKKFVTARGA